MTRFAVSPPRGSFSRDAQRSARLNHPPRTLPRTTIAVDACPPSGDCPRHNGLLVGRRLRNPERPSTIPAATSSGRAQPQPQDPPTDGAPLATNAAKPLPSTERQQPRRRVRSAPAPDVRDPAQSNMPAPRHLPLRHILQTPARRLGLGNRRGIRLDVSTPPSPRGAPPDRGDGAPTSTAHRSAWPGRTGEARKTRRTPTMIHADRSAARNRTCRRSRGRQGPYSNRCSAEHGTRSPAARG